MSLPKVNELEENQVHDEKVQVVAFHLAGAEYAVEIKYIEEINRLINITRVPRAPFYIEGVINLRGSIIPIINLHKKFNLAGQNFDERTRVIIFGIDNIKAAIIVDKVSGVMRLDVANIVEDNQFFSPINTEVIKGMIKVEDRLMIILDLEKMLDTEIN
ncbi:MAG: purine-binding chemotaxis protein CheW [Syntrophomonadaceae bacterium]|nr:purine-binding chemotaxis protein CheW [Syntrophomonadaceae bacterium]